MYLIMSSYYKTNSKISYPEFLKLVTSLTTFSSIRGNNYKILSIKNEKMKFIRLSTNKEWMMNLEAVHTAYKELQIFRTTDFSPYMARTKSPALGLLLTLGLLEKQ